MLMLTTNSDNQSWTLILAAAECFCCVPMPKVVSLLSLLKAGIDLRLLSNHWYTYLVGVFGQTRLHYQKAILKQAFEKTIRQKLGNCAWKWCGNGPNI